jgi:serine protease
MNEDVVKNDILISVLISSISVMKIFYSILSCLPVVLLSLLIQKAHCEKNSFVLMRSATVAEALISEINTDSELISEFNICSVEKASTISDSELNKWIAVQLQETQIASFIKKLHERKLIDYAEYNRKCILRTSDGETIQPAAVNFTFRNRTSVKVAVVDDAFLLTHESLKKYWYRNKNEIPGNFIDDDGNGYTDDVCGWDVADNDNEVTFPAGREKDFYHGTFLAGVIASYNNWKDAEGKLVLSCPIEIIPVKCLSDNSVQNYLKESYKGLEYAIRSGADIINCSWGGGQVSKYERDLIEAAKQRGILVIASAGNWSSELAQYPAAFTDVLAVSAVDSAGRKLPVSCFGSSTDLSARGKDIRAASIWGDHKDTSVTGSSASVAFVSGNAAVLLSCFPHLKAADLQYFLMAGALPVDSVNGRYAGKLGAGIPDIFNTARIINLGTRQEVLSNPEGYIILKGPVKSRRTEFTIKPSGKYKGIQIYRPLMLSEKKPGLTYSLSVTDLKNSDVREYDGTSFPDSVFVPADSVKLKISYKGKDQFLIPYKVVTVDSSRLYCHSVKILESEEGTIEDGSGANNYAGGQDCKWLISSKPGTRISIAFTEMDTEPNVDKVYIFNGEGTHEYILGIFSGNNLPPEVNSTGNKMLIWFVTDKANHGKGWKAKYKVIKEE